MTLRPAAALLLVLASPAWAHAIIVDSTPAPYAHVAAGPLSLVLRYNSRIDAARSKLVLRHGATDQRLAPTAAGAPDVLQASATVVPGEYQVVWQVLATDGHITRGRIPFTVMPPAGVPAGPVAAR